MPLIIYQTVEKIIPDNPIVAYLREHIKQGFIQNGELNIKLDKNLFKKIILVEDNLKANLHISNFEYKYHKDLPPLTKIDTNIIISGREIKFLINEAYSGKSLISDGIMTFKWEGPDKSQFIFNATAKGEINDLIAFVPSDTYKKIKAQNIDLSKIKGTANSIIELIIPISPDVPNRYNVLSTLTNISFNTLDNKVLLQNGEAKGSLKDNKLNISGKGNINNYESSFIYDHDISDKHNECLLKIKSNITANNQRFGVLKLISGTTILNFEYKKQHNNESFITVHSNLDNLEFYIDKVSIHKKLYKRANLYLYTKLNDTDRNIEFNLSGHDNLKIHGNVLIKENIYNINLASVKHNYTDLKGKIIIDNHNLNTELYGSGLDLSNANMMQFLEKEGDSTHNINLKTNISKIILKNNIILTNLDLVIKCDKVRCFYGFLNANIENKKVKMSLTAKDTFEQWLIESDNAGALLNGLGMYTTMQNGQIHIKLNTKRYEVKKGEIVPILDGKFSIKHFKVVDTPFLTRLVSFVSLPGFLSSITNNKNILFDDMTGKFNYRGNIITIFDTEAHGPFFDFTMKGNIDTKQQFITVTGNVIPSFFLISTIVTKIPVVGKIFSKVALYSLKMHYK
ncbi:transporter AmpG 3 [Rickettsia prowazekii str. Breinl]|nr:transporter AmpG 3 [Rickettsia prowazekii str. Breinl]